MPSIRRGPHEPAPCRWWRALAPAAAGTPLGTMPPPGAGATNQEEAGPGPGRDLRIRCRGATFVARRVGGDASNETEPRAGSRPVPSDRGSDVPGAGEEAALDAGHRQQHLPAQDRQARQDRQANQALDTGRWRGMMAAALARLRTRVTRRASADDRGRGRHRAPYLLCGRCDRHSPLFCQGFPTAACRAGNGGVRSLRVTISLRPWRCARPSPTTSPCGAET